MINFDDKKWEDNDAHRIYKYRTIGDYESADKLRAYFICCGCNVSILRNTVVIYQLTNIKQWWGDKNELSKLFSQLLNAYNADLIEWSKKLKDASRNRTLADIAYYERRIKKHPHLKNELDICIKYEKEILAKNKL